VEETKIETNGIWRGSIRATTPEGTQTFMSDGNRNYTATFFCKSNAVKLELDSIEGDLTLSVRGIKDRAGVEEEQAEEMLELMKIEYFADPELRLAKKVNEKPEPRWWYWKIKDFVEDYFMLFLSCTCLVFAYLILTR
jgi:hypothetical protein